MKTLSEFIKESLIEESESIKSEKDFRKAAEAKFKKVFGDELDEDKMNEIIDGILEDNKNSVNNGEWGKLIGILNKSFATNESLLIESKEPKMGAKVYDENDDEGKIIEIFNSKGINTGGYNDMEEFLDDYDDTGAMAEYLDMDRDFYRDVKNGKEYLIAVRLNTGEIGVYNWGVGGVHYK